MAVRCHNNTNPKSNFQVQLQWPYSNAKIRLSLDVKLPPHMARCPGLEVVGVMVAMAVAVAVAVGKKLEVIGEEHIPLINGTGV